MQKSDGRWQRQIFIPAIRRSPENRVPEPLYAALVEFWRRQGRTLPGRPDPEWRSVVDGDCWPQ